MSLSHFFIDHPQFAAVISIFIVVFGLAAMTILPVAQYPNIVPPTVQITTVYPGASAEVVARTVATPLEQSVNGVENMDYITSQSTGNGQLTITVIFKIGSDPNTDLLLTQNRVQDTLSRLPEEVQAQGVQVKKTIEALLLGVHVYSPDGSRSPEYISNYMLKIRDRIARLPGVADFQLFGERDYAMRIWIDPDKAAADDISANDIMSALRAQNAQVSAGVLNAPPITTHAAYQINVEALGRLTSPEQFGAIIVKSDNQGRVTRIRDIARVELGSVDYGSIAYADRYPSAPWFPIATPGANVVKLEHEIWDTMAELKKTFPPGTRLHKHLRSDDLRRPVHPRSHRDDFHCDPALSSALSSSFCRRGARRSFLWSPFRYRSSAPSRSSPHWEYQSITCRCSASSWPWALWSTMRSSWSRTSSAIWPRECRPERLLTRQWTKSPQLSSPSR